MIEITATLDEQALVEQVIEQALESHALREAAQEMASESGYEAGREAGQEAGYEAGTEAAREYEGEGVSWENLQNRMSNEFTGRAYESGCGEFRAYFNAVEWAMQESARLTDNEGGHQGILNTFRKDLLTEIQAGTGEGTDYVPITTSTGSTDITASLNQRVQDLELLVAGLGQALVTSIGTRSGDSVNLTTLRTYAETARDHAWPEWMAGLANTARATN